MWGFFNSIFETLVQAGWPLDVLIGLGVIALAIYIFFYFRRENKKGIVILERLTGIVEQNTELIGKTNELIRKESEHLIKENSLINELHNSVTALSYNLEALVNADERMTEQQAIILYEVIMEDVFKDIKEFYFDTNNWLVQKEYDRLADSTQDQLSQRVELVFDSIYTDLKNKLANFKYKENYLSTYLNDNFRREYSHIKIHIHSILTANSNGVKEYLKVKQERFTTDFKLYLKGKT